MPPSDKTARAVLQALGLTGVMAPAVACGPCLDIGGETGYTDDTGDTGEADDTGDEQSGIETAEQRVLDRDVLPDDVAALLKDKLSQRVEGAE